MGVWVWGGVCVWCVLGFSLIPLGEVLPNSGLTPRVLLLLVACTAPATRPLSGQVDRQRCSKHRMRMMVKMNHLGPTRPEHRVR